MQSRKKTGPVVGEDITVPPEVAREGKIAIRSEAAAEVARWFGLGKSRRLSRRRKRAATPISSFDIGSVELAPGTITLITGASGAGKSSLLRDLRSAHATSRCWIDLAELHPANVPIVNCF